MLPDLPSRMYVKLKVKLSSSSLEKSAVKGNRIGEIICVTTIRDMIDESYKYVFTVEWYHDKSVGEYNINDLTEVDSPRRGPNFAFKLMKRTKIHKKGQGQ